MQREIWKRGRRISACCVVLALAALLLQACTNRIARWEMYATVVQRTENALLVEPEEGSLERRSSDRLYVPAAEANLLDENRKPLRFEKFQEGDRVKVVYDGVIMETYPGQIKTCYEIQRVGQAEPPSTTE